MKKLNKWNPLLIFIILLPALASQCTIEDDDIPTEINYHNLVRCKVNGEEWKSYDWRTEGILPSVSRSWDLQYYTFGIKSISLGAGLLLKDHSINQSILMITKYDTIGDHNLIFIGKEFIDGNNLSGCKFYDLDTNAIRRMTILEIDTTEKIMVGSFEFDVINDCGDTVQIRDGYFDLIYRP